MKVGLPDLSKKRYFCFTFFLSKVRLFSNNFFQKGQGDQHSYFLVYLETCLGLGA